jgi:ABC-type dipeptide/oligopeptide/nickel transport system ATPase component
MRGPASRAERDRLGIELAMVFQDPLTSLNPALTIGRQLAEVLEVHAGTPRREALARAREALVRVGIPEPDRRLRQLPHELSGGQRQRAMIGMGLMGRPRLLIADEPTTALDVTVQRQVLSVIRRTQRMTGCAVLFISQDIALISGFCDRVVVMREGEVVEMLDAAHLSQAMHPYTRGLVACVPDMASDRSRPLPVIEDVMEDLDDAGPHLGEASSVGAGTGPRHAGTEGDGTGRRHAGTEGDGTGRSGPVSGRNGRAEPGGQGRGPGGSVRERPRR